MRCKGLALVLLALLSLGLVGFSLGQKTGDVNGDDEVNMDDLLLAMEAYGTTDAHVRWDERADVNMDSAVDITDLLIIILNFGT